MNPDFDAYNMGSKITLGTCAPLSAKVQFPEIPGVLPWVRGTTSPKDN